MKSKKDFASYLVAGGVLAVLALIALVLGGKVGGVDGAVPTYMEQVGEEQVICSDDDPANDFYLAGSARLGRIRYHDYCLNNGEFQYLYQYACNSNNDVEVTAGFRCPNGCSEGACLR